MKENLNKRKAAQHIVLALLIIWVGVIFSFSLRSGVSSHQQSNEMKNTIKTEMQDSHIPIDRSAYRVYRPFMKKGQQVNGEAFVRKSAHFFEYFMLGVLSVCFIHLRYRKGKALYLMVLLIGPAVAIIDEKIIQKFLVHGRTSSYKDVLLDSAGFCIAAIGTSLVVLLAKFLRQHRTGHNV